MKRDSLISVMNKDGRAIIIRDATEDDTEGILRLESRWIEEGLAANPLRPRPKSKFRKHSYMVVALEGDQIVGFASADLKTGDRADGEVARNEKCADVDDIYVLPERRGNGIGGALLEALVERGKAADAGKFFLEVESLDMNRAMRFYGKHGFSECPDSKSKPGNPRMFREL